MSKTYTGKEAYQKFEEALLKFGIFEHTPMYPFRAGYIHSLYPNDPSKKNYLLNLKIKLIRKYGGFVFSKEDKDIIARTVGHPCNLEKLKDYLDEKCTIREPYKECDWPYILRKLKGCLRRNKGKDGLRIKTPALETDETSILKYLFDEYPTEHTQDEINASFSKRRDPKTIRKFLKKLDKYELVEHPKGKKKGYVITTKGQNLYNRYYN